MEATQGEKLSYSFRKGSVPVTNTTLYKVFEEARENGANTEFYFMATEERVYLKDVWNKVSVILLEVGRSHSAGEPLLVQK